MGRSGGHQWGFLVAATGDFWWPPMGSFSRPPTNSTLSMGSTDAAACGGETMTPLRSTQVMPPLSLNSDTQGDPALRTCAARTAIGRSTIVVDSGPPRDRGTGAYTTPTNLEGHESHRSRCSALCMLNTCRARVPRSHGVRERRGHRAFARRGSRKCGCPWTTRAM